MVGKKHNLAVLVKSIDPSSGGISRVTDMIFSRLCEKGWRCFAITPQSYDTVPPYYHQVICEAADTPESVSLIVDFCVTFKIELVINAEGAFPRYLKLLTHLKQMCGMRIVSWFHQTPLILDNISDFHRKLPIPSGLSRILYSIYKSLYFRYRYSKGIRQLYCLSDLYVLLDGTYTGQFATYNHIEDISKIIVVNNPAPEKRSNTGCEVKGNIALYVGRMSEEKRVDRILAVWQRFYLIHSDWELWLIGDGPVRESSIRLANGLGSGGLRFLGHINDVTPYYGKAKMLLLASDYEGWPMVIVEAMSYGVVPIVYDSFTALHSIISDGKSGYIVQAASDEEEICREFVISMERCIDEYEYIAEEASGVSRRFDLDMITNRWDGLLSDLLSSSHSNQTGR